MLLFGQYSLNDIVQALQGHFDCKVEADLITFDYYQINITIEDKLLTLSVRNRTDGRETLKKIGTIQLT